VSFAQQYRSDEKQALFGRLAQHLTSLALEVEKTIGTNGANVAHVADVEPAVAADHEQGAAADYQRAPRSHRTLPWLLAFVFVAITGAFIWANNSAENGTSSVAAVQSMPEPSPAPPDHTKQSIAALQPSPASPDETKKQSMAALQQAVKDLQQALKDLQGERKLLSEQLGTLAARVDSLENARAEFAQPTTPRRRRR
jgi:hypothetical protein